MVKVASKLEKKTFVHKPLPLNLDCIFTVSVRANTDRATASRNVPLFAAVHLIDADYDFDMSA